MEIKRRRLLLGTLGLVAGHAAGAEAPTRSAAPPPADPRESIDLWPAGAPGAPPTPLVETMVERSTDKSLSDRHVLGIERPRLVVFRPAVPNGASLLIAPGGGYRWVVVDREGFEMGRWLAARGVTAFVMFYRLPGEGWAAGPNVSLVDAQRAMRMIRHRAGEFGIDPARVGAMGFSAGGHVCASLLARFDEKIEAPVDAADKLSARPFIAAPIYPVVTMRAPHAHAGSREKLIGADASAAREHAHSPHLHVPDDAPPTFLVHAEDDASVPVENTLLLRAALRTRQVPVETHLFTHGGHGFGIRKAMGKPAEAWPGLFMAWAKARGWM